MLDRPSGRPRRLHEPRAACPSRTSPALGETLYTDHLITVELAGAPAVRRPDRRRWRSPTPRPPIRPGDRTPPPTAVDLRPESRLTTRPDRPNPRASPCPTPFTFDILRNYLLVGAALMALGMLGFLARRNLIVMFLSAEMMLQGTALTLVGFGRYHGNWTGQVFTIVILTVAACEASIALALILILFNRRSSLDVTLWQEIREPGPAADRRRRGRRGRAVEAIPGPESYPHLTPAGIEPAHPREPWTVRRD